MVDEVILKSANGPTRPVIEALEENDLFEGWIRHLDAGSALQAQNYHRDGGEQVEDGDTVREYYQGLDGQTWALGHLVNEHFPNLLRAAAFLVIWGAFERHMVELCDEVRSAQRYKVTLDDLSGRGIARVHSYLVKVAGLDGPWARDHWAELVKLQKIRNLFAHSDGRVLPSQREQRLVIQHNEHLGLDGSSVLLAASFLPFLLDLHRRFLQSLHESIAAAFGESA
jgi:hypothetical protein